MTPEFLIKADGEDVTAKIADRSLSIRVIDEDGIKADRMTIEVDDRDNRLELPEVGAELEIWLGFSGSALSYMGKFVADGISGTGPKLSMKVTGTAANMVSSIRAPKTRAWENISLPDMVDKIAAEAGLRGVIGQSLQEVFYPYVAQSAESNLHLLTRLGVDLDATAKPAGGSLVVQKRGEGLNAAGEKVEPASIPGQRLAGWNWEIKEREAYKTVEAEWGDTDGGETRKVTAGSGEPIRRLRHVYPNAEEATRAAQSELALSGRSVFSGNFEIAGFEASLFAAGQAEISGLREELNGVWHVERVEHRFDSALKTTFKARLARG